MTRELTQVDPLSAGKVFGVMYFAFGLLFIPFMAFPLLVPADEGPPAAMFMFFGLFAPVFYGAAGFFSGVLCSVLYNLFAGWVGGIRITIDDGTDQPARTSA